MHDPKTVAHEVSIFGKTLITVWHNDPETNGADDSCGWSTPHPIEAHEKIINEMVEWDKDFPFFSSKANVHASLVFNSEYSYREQQVGDCLVMRYAAWSRLVWKIEKRGELTPSEIKDIFNHPHDSLRAILSDAEENPQYRAKRFLYCVLKEYLRHHRKWYQHPKWHIHHWSLQIHIWQKVKRFLFEKCGVCGKRYTWGYSPIRITTTATVHHECYPQASEVAP